MLQPIESRPPRGRRDWRLPSRRAATRDDGEPGFASSPPIVRASCTPGSPPRPSPTRRPSPPARPRRAPRIPRRTRTGSARPARCRSRGTPAAPGRGSRTASRPRWSGPAATAWRPPGASRRGRAGSSSASGRTRRAWAARVAHHAGCHSAPHRCQRRDTRSRRVRLRVCVRGAGVDPRPLWPTSRDEPILPATCLEGALAMPPFIRPAQRRIRMLATSLLIVSLVAACDSSVTPTPSPASSAASTPFPSHHPRRRHRPAVPPPDARPGHVAARRALGQSGSRRSRPRRARGDRLRSAARRSKPLVDSSSALYAPLLPTGTQLQVIDGPVEGSGYSWVRVTPVGLTLDKGVSDGWVAVADHDGTPWVALADAPLAGLDVAQAAVARAPVNVGDARRTAGDLNAFGLALYKRLLTDPDAKLNGKGVIMSPASIAVALAMARAGARGDTASQMDACSETTAGTTWRPASGRCSRSSPATTGRGRTRRARAIRSRSTSRTARSARSAVPSWTATCGGSARRSAPGSASSTTAGTRTSPAPPSTAGSRGRPTTASSSCWDRPT